MQKHSSPVMQLTKRRAAFRVRQLLDEFQLLMAAFPDLHDAFDPDELPLAFILERDSRLTRADAEPSRRLPPGANTLVRPRTMSSRTQSRGRRRKQMSDE
jgi:hypothetical protein